MNTISTPMRLPGGEWLASFSALGQSNFAASFLHISRLFSPIYGAHEEVCRGLTTRGNATLVVTILSTSLYLL